MSGLNLPDHLVFHGNGGKDPPYGTITSKNHGPAIVVTVWILVCIMGLAVAARFGTRRNMDSSGVSICIASVRMSVRVQFLCYFEFAKNKVNLSYLEDISNMSKRNNPSGCKPWPWKT